jgi:hypothetical protein
MGDEEEVAQTVQKALIFGSASFIGAALMETMETSGYAVEAGHAGSDVLSADVIVCSAYGNDTVRSSAPETQPSTRCFVTRALHAFGAG